MFIKKRVCMNCLQILWKCIPRTLNIYMRLCVTQLPSRCQGGTVHLSHAGEPLPTGADTDSDTDPQFGLFFTAFYSEVDHKVECVTDGDRLTAVYRLLWVPKPGAPVSQRPSAALAVGYQSQGLEF